ncbi:MAG: alanine dehydrogenase, partial [Bacteroidales bacterium]|nr:alanine dehydrogenase [Bacteroidales bacterium]
ASIALSNVFTPLLLNIGDSGSLLKYLHEDQGLRKGVYLFNGILTNRFIGSRFGIMSKDIDLLLAAF